MLFVTVIAQFTAKITNSEKAIYFLSLCHLRLSLMLSTFCHLCSINTLKSHMFFTRKSFMFSDFTWKKNILLQEMVRGAEGGWRPLPPFPTALSMYLLTQSELSPEYKNWWLSFSCSKILWLSLLLRMTLLLSESSR